MPDASLYATVAYLLTVLALTGYVGRLVLRARWVERRLREMGEASGTANVPPTSPDALRSGTLGRSDPRERSHDVPEVSRV